MQNKFAFHLLKSRVLTGNCLVAELYRLSLLTPNDFVDVSSSAFNKLLIDFSYFDNRLAFDNFSGETEEGHQLDEKFFAIYSPFLRSFDKFLDRFYTFITDFVEFTADFASLREQFSRAKRLEELESLAAQVLYLLGLLLFMLDFKFPGSVRERIFVALYRQRVDFESRKLETLVNLLRNRREPFDTCFTSLQLDDYFLAQIYTFLRFYKGPHYGWLQNALFVTLYFESDHDTLHNQFLVMRQIIDNFFADSWILHLHIDFRVNLFEKWDRFKAASAALASTNDYQNALKMASKHLASLRAFPLPTGLLSLEKFEEYEKHLVDMNAKLRWLILHSSAEEFSPATGKKKTAAASMSNFMPKEAQKDLIVALKRLAEFEFKMGQATAHLRKNREECVQRLKQHIGDNLGQNIAFLRNSPAIGGGKKRTERIISWLDSMHSSVEEISANDDNNKSTSMALSQLELLRARCSDLLQLQADESDQQQLILRQSLLVAGADLHRLHNICAFDDASVGELMARTDSTYLFHFVNDQCAQMEVLLREEAQSVKFIFQKVANSVPMLICGEVAAPKQKRLVSFYCKVLELRLRAVIQAIPRAIFEEMAKLNQHFSADTHVHVDKARLRDFIDLPRRRKLAELTHQIAKLALGIANTCLKQLGDVQVQPRALLCDGLRSELSKRLATILADSRQPTIFRTIQTQHVQLAQSRKAFLFVCDHVGIRDGVQIWAEQLQLAVKTILARKFVQITAVPAIGPSTATTVSSGKPEAVLERFFDFAMTATKPSACIYNPIESAWRSVSEGNAVKFTYTAFAVLDDWFLFGLGSLLGALLAHDLRDLARRLERESTIVSGLQQQQKSMAPFPVDPIKIRQLLSSPAAIADFAADGPNRELLQALARLGQYRLLLANLHLFMEAEAHSLLGIVHGARNGLARTFELTSPLTPVNDKLAQSLFANPAEFARQMPKFANLKAIKAHLFLLSLIIHFSMLGSNSPPSSSSRKRAYDFLDGFAIIQGALLLLETSPIWRRFLHSQKYLAAEEKATAKSATNPRLSLLTIQRFTDSI